jgi:ATP-dependent DNA ligase
MDGELGQAMFKHACRMGLEGIVSKRRDRPYVAGRSTMWLKIKNPASAAARRVWAYPLGLGPARSDGGREIIQ